MGGTLLVTGYGCLILLSKAENVRITMEKERKEEQKEAEENRYKKVKVKTEPNELRGVKMEDDHKQKNKDSTLRQRRSCYCLFNKHSILFEIPPSTCNHSTMDNTVVLYITFSWYIFILTITRNTS